MSRIEELWTRSLEASLSAEEEVELLRALEADPALRDRLLDDREMDGLVDALSSRDQDAFQRAFADRLAMERDGSRFVARVERRVRRRPRPGTPSFLPAVIAAGVFVAIVLIALAARSKPSPARIAERPQPRIEVPAPLPAPEPERKVAPPPPPPAPRPPKKDVEPPAEAPLPPPAPEAPKPPAPPPIPVPAPKETPAPPPTKTAVAMILKVERPNGETSELPAGASLEGAATLLYRDGTRVELGAETAVGELRDAPKTMLLSRGTLAADVVRQAQPMLIRTPHAEARVLGTSFQLTVEADATRLEVKTGKVRLTRLADGKFVDVLSGRSALSSEIAVKPRPTLLSETFDGGVETRWTSVEGTPVKTAGRLDIDLSSRAAEGWSGGGLKTKSTFAAPFAASVDVDVPLTHEGIVTAVVFIPAGGKRKDPGVFRLQLRGGRYSLMSESGEPRELAGAARAGSGRERWRLELRGSEARVFVNDKELFRHTHDLPVSPGYAIQLDASARSDAPAGAKASFDTVVVEPLRP